MKGAIRIKETSKMDPIIKTALECNRERRMWKFLSQFSVAGAIISTIGFIIAVRGGL